MREGIDRLLQLPVRPVDEARDLRLGIGERGRKLRGSYSLEVVCPQGSVSLKRLFAPS